MAADITEGFETNTTFDYAYLVENAGEKLDTLPSGYIYVTQNKVTCAHLIAANVPCIYVHDLQQRLGIIPSKLFYCDDMESLVLLYRAHIPLPEGGEYVVETVNNDWRVTYAR